MEDFFESYVCSNCSNKSKDCRCIHIIIERDITTTQCVNYKRKKDKKIGDFDFEEFFINRIAPTTTKQEKLNADYYQC